MTGRMLVIGGGIGGLATALAARKAGWGVEVFERAPELREVGAGIALWANGLRALDRLGVGDRVRAAARPHAGGAIRNDAGRILMTVETPEGGAEWLGCMIHRADLLSILAESVGVDTVRTGRDLRGVTQRDARVTASFADGSTAHGDILVGADGIHSRVRGAVLGDVAPRYAGYTVWRWVAPFPAERVLPGETWGAGARFGQACLPGDRVYVYATSNAPAGGKGPLGEMSVLRALFAGWHDPIPALVEATAGADILRNDCFDIPPQKRWGRGRITLVGDAAHAMTPNLGQGACQALEDAVALGRWLDGAADPEQALRGYEAERRPRAIRFQRQSRSAGALGQWSSPLGIRFRELVARTVLPRLQKKTLSSLVTERP